MVAQHDVGSESGDGETAGWDEALAEIGGDSSEDSGTDLSSEAEPAPLETEVAPQCVVVRDEALHLIGLDEADQAAQLDLVPRGSRMICDERLDEWGVQIGDHLVITKTHLGGTVSEAEALGTSDKILRFQRVVVAAMVRAMERERWRQRASSIVRPPTGSAPRLVVYLEFVAYDGVDLTLAVATKPLGRKVRLTITDAAGHNLRAEWQIVAEKGESWNTITILCDVHVTIGTHTKTDEAAETAISSMIAVSLSLAGAGNMSLLRASLRKVLAARLADLSRAADCPVVLGEDVGLVYLQRCGERGPSRNHVQVHGGGLAKRSPLRVLRERERNREGRSGGIVPTIRAGVAWPLSLDIPASQVGGSKQSSPASWASHKHAWSIEQGLRGLRQVLFRGGVC